MLRYSLVTAAFVFTLPAGAAAHAFLTRAVPAANSTVTPPPAEIRLIFGSRLESGFAKVEVSVDGQKLTNLPKASTGADGRTVSLALPGAAPGAYRVTWSVVAHDGHRTSGTYNFTATAK